MIHTPFGVIKLMLDEHREKGTVLNPSVCTKIDFKGYEISIAMDSSLKFGRDLFRADIRVFRGNEDVTKRFLREDEDMLYGNAETLLRVMKDIDQGL